MRWADIAAQPGDPASSARLMGEIARQAAGISYANDFYILAFATCLALPLVLMLKVQSPPAAAPGAAAAKPAARDEPMLDAGH